MITSQSGQTLMTIFRTSQGTHGSSDFFAVADATTNNANVINNFMANANLWDCAKNWNLFCLYTNYDKGFQLILNLDFF